jgi:hypothetical protein
MASRKNPGVSRNIPHRYFLDRDLLGWHRATHTTPDFCSPLCRKEPRRALRQSGQILGYPGAVREYPDDRA